MNRLQLTLYDTLAYLIPGGVVLASMLVTLIVVMPGSAVSLDLLDHTWFVGAFIILRYALGHPLFSLSASVPRMDYLLSGRRTMTQRAIRRATFYDDMVKRLEDYFGTERMDKGDVMGYSLRIVCEKMPSSNLTMDRLLSLTLFSRNMFVGGLLSCAILSFTFSKEFSLVVLILMGLLVLSSYFFFRSYRAHYAAYYITCWRSTHIWLVEYAKSLRES